MQRAVLAILALALAACTTAPAPPVTAAPAAAPEPATTLAGTRWIGVVAGDPDPRTLPRLEFLGGGRVTGYTGCNMLNGAWRMEGGEVRLGPLVTTKRACLGPEGDAEQRFLAAAGGRVAREGERLVFTGPRGERFEFRAAQAS
jgi:putative lipoprotein